MRLLCFLEMHDTHTHTHSFLGSQKKKEKKGWEMRRIQTNTLDRFALDTLFRVDAVAVQVEKKNCTRALKQQK